MPLFTRHTCSIILALLLWGSPVTAAQGKIMLYVQHEAYHTSLIIPAGAVFQAAPQLRALDLRPSRFIRFGWGDEVYYGREQRSSGTALSALLLPGASVMEVTPIDFPWQLPGALLEIPAYPDQVEKMVREIAGSFYTGETDADYQLLRTGYGDRSYYTAVGAYYLLNNCNHWTGRKLRSLGFAASRLGNVFAGSLISRISSQLDPAFIITSTAQLLPEEFPSPIDISTDQPSAGETR